MLHRPWRLEDSKYDVRPAQLPNDDVRIQHCVPTLTTHCVQVLCHHDVLARINDGYFLVSPNAMIISGRIEVRQVIHDLRYTYAPSPPTLSPRCPSPDGQHRPRLTLQLSHIYLCGELARSWTPLVVPRSSVVCWQSSTTLSSPLFR
jgi:hypothetical protein